MAGLEAVGIPGSEALTEALTNCTDPIAAIEEFQDQNGIQLPSLRPALPFLDLHGVRRNEFHVSVMEELREKLLTKITELANGDHPRRNTILHDLLEKSFPVLKKKELRPIVIGIMKHIPNISPQLLKRVLEDQELYKDSSTEVKRQIWRDHQGLFGDEVSPLFTKYINEKEELLLDHVPSNLSFFTITPKQRRQGTVVQTLVNMIGKDVKLYEMMLNFVQTLFLRTRNVHYCTLRAELLMALHDLDVHEICSVDPCHKFTWCLDACIREHYIDAKRSKELHAFLDCIKVGQEIVLGHLSMILCDPYAMNTIAESVYRSLQSCITSESLPRDCPDLVLFLRMLNLGLNAWTIIDTQIFKEPRLGSELITQFLPTIMAFMVDESISSVISKMPDEPVPLLTLVSEIYMKNIINKPLAGYLALHHVIYASSKQKSKMAVCRVLEHTLRCDNDCALEDPFLHSLVTHLIGMQDHFHNEDFCICVFDDFFMPAISKENMIRHLLRLLYHVHHRISAQRLDNLMAIIEPGSEHGEKVHSAYGATMEKVKAHQAVPAPPPPPKLDSPVAAIPPPTPSHPGLDARTY